MPLPADFTYDRDADCFVVTDATGNELCRTASPHHASDKLLVTFLTAELNKGRIIFPTTGDTKPLHVG